jgi:sigma-B regulation protein RsbU (phosphoserine phosphatase)
VVVDDFEPYHPSYNSAAAFIASPIFDGEEMVGVLAFQMPIDRINQIMTNDQNWADVGLGESGETYIVAGDFKLRNQSRFLIEDSENYFRMIESTGTSAATVDQIRNLNTSIGLQEVRTEGTRDALAGHSDTRIFEDYRGVAVLSSYRPLDIDGLNWVIMSEIDEAEAFAAIARLARELLLTVTFLLVFTIFAAGVVARTITRPLARLGRNSRALAGGDLEVQIDTSSGDEIGDLSRDFEHMRQSLKKYLNELESLNANLEQKVTDRTAELAASEEKLAKANARMLGELNFAREIQMGMVPLLFPVFPDRPELALHAVLKPAREVGGDFYDFYFLDDNHLCMVIADVAGKGAPAALFMAVSKTLIKSRAANDFEPSSILTQVNGELSENNTTATFVTVFLAVLDVTTGLLRYCNAGHNPPLIKLESGHLKKLDSLHGPILGVLPGLTYTQDEYLMAKGDTLLMFTDGINEAMNEQEEEYTDRRLEDLLTKSIAQSPEELSNEIIANVRDHRKSAEQSDDITLLAMKYRGLRLGAEQNLTIRIRNDISEIASVEEQFHEFATRNGIHDTDRQTVSLVLDDLLSNIISYAWPDGGDHEILLDLTRYGSRLVLTVEDDGIPFNPFSADAPALELSLEERSIGGLGIHLVRESMDEHVYQRRANRNVVILARNLREK